MNYYDEIKNQILKSEIFDKVHDYVKDRNKINVYFEIGRLLSEAGKEYGKNIIKQYADKLVVDIGKKYNISTLYKIRRFYEVFSNSKLAPMEPTLSWSHYKELLSIKDINAIKYYIEISEKNNLTKRNLHELIKQQVYMNYIDEHLKNINQNKTIGIIICKQNNKYVIKYCSDMRIISRVYEFV